MNSFHEKVLHHGKAVKAHVKKHHKKYLGWFFAWFAIFKTIKVAIVAAWLLFWLMNTQNTSAQVAEPEDPAVAGAENQSQCMFDEAFCLWLLNGGLINQEKVEMCFEDAHLVVSDRLSGGLHMQNYPNLNILWIQEGSIKSYLESYGNNYCSCCSWGGIDGDCCDNMKTNCAAYFPDQQDICEQLTEKC